MKSTIKTKKSFIPVFTLLLIAFLCIRFTLHAEEPEQHSILSTAEEIAASKSGSNLIGGVVSPLTGQICLSRTDLIAKGAHDVELTRYYRQHALLCGLGERETYNYLKSSYKGWLCFPHHYALNKGNKILRFMQPCGVSVDFAPKDPKDLSTYQLLGSHAGICNAINDIPSGQHDLRNTKITIADEGKSVIIQDPNGNRRQYRFSNSFCFLLDKEICPNGKILKYSHNKHNQLIRVESQDPQERYTYASIDIQGTPKERKQQFVTHTRLSAQHSYQQIKQQFSKNDPAETYTLIYPPLLTHSESPYTPKEEIRHTDSFLINNYYTGQNDWSCQYAPFTRDGQPAFFRINALFLSTSTASEQPLYSISYFPPIANQHQGATTVKQSDGTTHIYHFSKQLLPIVIQSFDAQGTLVKEKCTHWNNRNWLVCVDIKDGQQQSLIKTSYRYDSLGNPVTEILTGNLTGAKEQENYTIKRKFSQDGFNLFLEESAEDQPTLTIHYLPETNLPLAKFTKAGNAIYKRHFFEYDDSNNLIKEIIDDGTTEEKEDLTHVTQRTITKISRRQEQPFLHMPEWIEEAYGEHELPLKKTHLLYDTYGNICTEEIYDSQGTYAYAIDKEYHPNGDLLSETNPLGELTTYTYDDNHNCTSITTPKRQTHMRYDTQGNCIEKTEKGSDIPHTTTYKYDPYHRLIEEVDPYGNSTLYTYDLITNRIIAKQHCGIVTRSTYDALGREISKTDANGNTTQIQYNAYGSPLTITHPDQSQEQFLYTKSGQLISHTTASGTINYTYDIQGRILSKTKTVDGTPISTESYQYNTFHLISHTDPLGTITHYQYDPAGRKIQTQCLNRITQYHYDTLGRVNEVHTLNDTQTLITQYKRDPLNRITEIAKKDLNNNLLDQICYTYDSAGNQTSITRNQNTETFHYDFLNRLIQIESPYQEITTITYEHTQNALGQGVLLKTTQDPTGLTLVEEYDPHGRVIRKTIRNPLLNQQEMTYDPNGNLIQQEEYTAQNSHKIRYQYNWQNQIESFTRAYDTPQARTTTFTYTPTGKLFSKTLPDNTTLYYTYDPAGHLHTLTSSNGQISHQFTYNALGHLIQAKDLNQNTVITRQLNPFGEIEQETLGELTLTKSYDPFGRPLTMTLPNQEVISYAYNPLHLTHIRRKEFTHSYEYDFNGNLLQETLINNQTVTHSYDRKGRKTKIDSPTFTESYTYDCKNLIAKEHNNHSIFYSYDSLSQLTAEQGIIYTYDSHYNRLSKNQTAYTLNALDELIQQGTTTYTYDLNGNLSKKCTCKETITYTYDPLHRLIQATTPKQHIQFTYDPLGRCLSKTVTTKGFFSTSQTQELYLYDNHEEIGTFVNGKLKQLRLAGPSTAIIELNGTPYAVISDIQGNVRQLIQSKPTHIYTYSAFGEEQQKVEPKLNPWRFASKRLHPELNLIAFGKRYYDPQLGRWITLDPALFIDGTNLYQYVYNNPFCYQDPDGQFVFALPLLSFGLGTAITWALPTVTTIAYTALAAGAVYGALKAYEEYQAHRAIQQAAEKTRDVYQQAKRHTPDQEALSDLVEQSGRKGVSNADADTLLEWAEEYDFYHRDDRGVDHWKEGEHIHVGHNNHIKVR